METYYQFTLSDDFSSCQIDIKLIILAPNSHDPPFLRYNLEIPLSLFLTALPVPYPFPLPGPHPQLPNFPALPAATTRSPCAQLLPVLLPYFSVHPLLLAQSAWILKTAMGQRLSTIKAFCDRGSAQKWRQPRRRGQSSSIAGSSRLPHL